MFTLLRLSKGRLDFTWSPPATDPGGQPCSDSKVNYDMPLHISKYKFASVRI
jgi:hypothetical protein